jgi:hypothetical protein
MMFGVVILLLLVAIYLLSPSVAWVALVALVAYVLASRRPERPESTNVAG